MAGGVHEVEQQSAFRLTARGLAAPSHGVPPSHGYLAVLLVLTVVHVPHLPLGVALHSVNFTSWVCSASMSMKVRLAVVQVKARQAWLAFLANQVDCGLHADAGTPR